MPPQSNQDAAMTSTVSPEFRIGLPAIDAEHGVLMESLRRLHLAPRDEPRSEPFLEVISLLGQQLILHFGNEEKHLNSCGLPNDEIRNHIRAHNHILEQYAQLQDDLMADKDINQSSVLTMIQHWIVTHITTHDLKIRQHLGN